MYGEVQERNLGECDHGRLQGKLFVYFYQREKQWGILSPEDQISRTSERFADYFTFGVPYVFLIDPQSQKAWSCTAGGMTEISELRTREP